MNRIKTIRTRLQQAFSPTHLEVLDESHQHIGHAGSQGGAGHYAIVITATCFAGLSRVEIHRKIYAVLADLIPHEIHALRISSSLSKHTPPPPRVNSNQVKGK